MRLDLHPFHAAFARIGVAPYTDHTARRFHVGAAGNHVIAHRRVRAHGECAVPEFAVQMFGVGAFHALPRAKAHVDRAPGGEERGESAHIGLRRAAAAEIRGDLGVARGVEQAGLSD